jgi:hypothetical protein
MKQYIVLIRPPRSSRSSVLNSAIFNSFEEAEKVAQYHKLKYRTERELSKKFWGEDVEIEDPILEVVKIDIPEKFWKD